MPVEREDPHKPLVVIVDDDDDIREAVRDTVAREGYETESATNGWEALQILQRARDEPCIVILDLMMPVMDGLELLWRIDAAGLRTYVIVLTAAREPAVPPGTVLLAKPIQRDTLLAAVDDAAAQLTQPH